MRGWPLSAKQEEFLDRLVEEALAAGIAGAPCIEDPCDKCAEVFELDRGLKERSAQNE